MHPNSQDRLPKSILVVARRLPIALLIAVVTMAAIGSGYAATATADLPETFGTPARQGGDHGTYVTEVLAGDLARFTTRLTFQTTADTPFYAADGHIDRGDIIREERRDVNGDETFDWWMDNHIGEAGTMTRLLWKIESWSGLRSELVGVHAGGSTPEHEFRRVHTYYDQEWSMCGLRNDLQGAHVPTTDPVRFHGACGADHLIAWARAEIGNKTAIGYADPDEPQRIQVWMQEDLPYPIAILEWRGDALLQTRLTTFSAGNGTRSDEVLAPLPTVALVPHAGTPTPPAGLVPYSLEAAISDAARQPQATSIQTMLDDPASYVLKASYDEVEGRDLVTQRWSVTLSDGHGAISFAISRDGQDATEARLPLLGDPTPGLDLEMQSAPKGPFPTAAALPATLPDLGDVEAAFTRWSGLPANAYAFSYRCRDSCDDVEGRVAVGQWRFSEDAGHQNVYVGGPILPPEPGVVGHRLWYDESARIVKGETLYQRQTAGGTLEGDPTDTVGMPDDARPQASAHWEVPTQFAAGTGALALLLAAAYLFWPTIKQGLGAGLFSRIAGSALLRHPARAAIHQAVEADPGVGIQEIADRLGRPLSTVRHHVGKLVEGGLIMRIDTHQRSGLYLKGTVSPAAARALAMAHSSGAGAILCSLAREGPSPVSMLAKRQGVTTGTASYHLRRLREEGLVTSRRDGRRVVYEATPDVVGAIGGDAACA